MTQILKLEIKQMEHFFILLNPTTTKLYCAFFS